MICSQLRILLAFLSIMAALPAGSAIRAKAFDESSFVVVRGRIVCLNEAGRPLDSLFDCNTSRFGLIDKDAKLYTFSPADSATAIFTDERVRQRELQVAARLSGENQLEIIRVQSIREGKLHDIYYFCEVCNIRAYAPGLCPCCRDELEFRETPL